MEKKNQAGISTAPAVSTRTSMVGHATAVMPDTDTDAGSYKKERGSECG